MNVGEMLSHPSWSGIGAIAGLAAVLLVVWLERVKLFPERLREFIGAVVGGLLLGMVGFALCLVGGWLGADLADALIKGSSGPMRTILEWVAPWINLLALLATPIVVLVAYAKLKEYIVGPQEIKPPGTSAPNTQDFERLGCLMMMIGVIVDIVVMAQLGIRRR